MVKVTGDTWVNRNVHQAYKPSRGSSPRNCETFTTTTPTLCERHPRGAIGARFLKVVSLSSVSRRSCTPLSFSGRVWRTCALRPISDRYSRRWGETAGQHAYSLFLHTQEQRIATVGTHRLLMVTRGLSCCGGYTGTQPELHRAGAHVCVDGFS